MKAALLALVALGAAAPAAAAAGVTIKPYGTTREGRDVFQIILRNERGMEVRLINYGAIVTDVIVPDARGRKANVALGFGTLAEYETKNGNYGFGAVMGRYAGRIANARFSVDGKPVTLAANDGPNTLHGGPGGFDTKIWDVRPTGSGGDAGAVLHYVSPAGEQNFPGRLDVTVTYTLTRKNELRLDYQARTDAPTALNLTNHSYFNLAGAGSGTVRDHVLTIPANRILETSPAGIPTGAYVDVAGTPFDFRRGAVIGTMMDRPHPQLEGRRGINHSWVLGNRGRLALAASLRDPASGRRLDVLTTEPSLLAYTADYFPGTDAGAQGAIYRKHDAIALEAQHFPDAPNRPDFPSTILRPGETYRATTVFRFSADRR
ncbi:aldose epimerase family protein [Sphingosinicella sp. BN140058]|uniref:aldose epimerase family protein n=1 Tax=Sphingosinicella sp. BN140058 TaxID=1892855 RepID=UPI001011AFCE|nr:aldose epimerase family protein [Sphingosinicella sp. BN140058]QAY77882.1 galactose mutarotase [Sphingosinicella sp. BN140058]